MKIPVQKVRASRRRARPLPQGSPQARSAPLGGPVIALAAAATGAYLGSLAGAMDGLGNHNDKPHAPERLPGGVTLSVRIANPIDETRVIATLRAQGAAAIGRSIGIGCPLARVFHALQHSSD